MTHEYRDSVMHTSLGICKGSVRVKLNAEVCFKTIWGGNLKFIVKTRRLTAQKDRYSPVCA